MRLARPSLTILLVAAVLALGVAGAAAQDEPTPELISTDGAAEAPPRSDEAAYTQWFVRQAIERYDAEGRDAALEYFNDPASVDGQWYVFIVNAEGILIDHATRPDLLGTSTAARRDAFGKPYGQEIVAATSDTGLGRRIKEFADRKGILVNVVDNDYVDGDLLGYLLEAAVTLDDRRRAEL